tara:strand:+ start:944 stop:1174 length:231 start_codon:yes stop_codon:yes gene_type:complete
MVLPTFRIEKKEFKITGKKLKKMIEAGLGALLAFFFITPLIREPIMNLLNIELIEFLPIKIFLSSAIGFYISQVID